MQILFLGLGPIPQESPCPPSCVPQPAGIFSRERDVRVCDMDSVEFQEEPQRSQSGTQTTQPSHLTKYPSAAPGPKGTLASVTLWGDSTE